VSVTFRDFMECGGKRSATPLWLVFVPYPSQDEPQDEPHAKAASRFACRRTPYNTLGCNGYKSG